MSEPEGCKRWLQGEEVWSQPQTVQESSPSHRFTNVTRTPPKNWIVHGLD